MHMRERFAEIPRTARQPFLNQSLDRFPQILLSTDIGEAQVSLFAKGMSQSNMEESNAEKSRPL
jgi:hypothetical protein